MKETEIFNQSGVLQFKVMRQDKSRRQKRFGSILPHHKTGIRAQMGEFIHAARTTGDGLGILLVWKHSQEDGF